MSKTDQNKCARCNGEGVEPDETKMGVRFRKLREEAGLTIKQVSEKMRVSMGHLSSLENGKRHWRPDTIEGFQRALLVLKKR